MTENTGWEQVSCTERDALVDSGLRPIARLTGREDRPVARTAWGRGGAPAVLRDVAWRDSGTPCEHYVPAGTRPTEVAE